MMSKVSDLSGGDASRTASGNGSMSANLTRRSFLHHAGSVVALFAYGQIPTHASALPDDDAFRLAPIGEVVRHLGGTPADSNDIAVTAPDVAENGRNVPVSVTTSLSEVQAIYVLVESNPFPFAAAFSIPEGTDANISVRLKLAQSGKVIGIVRAANELFWASRYVQVTVGGCA